MRSTASDRRGGSVSRPTRGIRADKADGRRGVTQACAIDILTEELELTWNRGERGDSQERVELARIGNRTRYGSLDLRDSRAHRNTQYLFDGWRAGGENRTHLCMVRHRKIPWPFRRSLLSCSGSTQVQLIDPICRTVLNADQTREQEEEG